MESPVPTRTGPFPRYHAEHDGRLSAAHATVVLTAIADETRPRLGNRLRTTRRHTAVAGPLRCPAVPHPKV